MITDSYISVSDYLAATSAYQAALKSALQPHCESVFSLDTNVALDELNLSSDVRSAFASFLSNNGKRIIITNQVKTEYDRYAPEFPNAFDVSSCQILPPLKPDRVEQLKGEFDAHRTNPSVYVFPGMGDIKGKPDNPYGDYLIFHELLAFMKLNAVDVIFLTNDIFKGDWVTNRRFPHRHIIEMSYKITGQSLVILPASRFIRRAFRPRTESTVSDFYDHTEIYRNRFNEMWAELQRLSPRAADAGWQRQLEDLRKISKIVTCAEDLTHNGYINESWLFLMERLLSDARSD